MRTVEEAIFEGARMAAIQTWTPNYLLVCKKDFDAMVEWDLEFQLTWMWEKMRLSHHDFTTRMGMMNVARKLHKRRGIKWSAIDWAKSKKLL